MQNYLSTSKQKWRRSSLSSSSKMIEAHLKIVGCILIVLSLVHVFFPKYFNWANDFLSVSLINRQMMYVHTFFLALMLLLIGLLCITSATELVATRLGNKICLGLGIFWMLRLYVQFFIYSPQLWKGKRFETTIHILFSILWVYLSVVFLYVYIQIKSWFNSLQHHACLII